MLIIGIAGGSGSGKTTVVRAITEQLQENVVVIPQDSYFKDLSHYTEEQKRVHNFDHPDSIDFDLLRAQLAELREGKVVEQPVYSYITCGRSKNETVTVKPSDVIIVEGILIFTDPELRKLMDIKIFVDADDDDRLMRVMARDIVERGKTVRAMDVLFPKIGEIIGGSERESSLQKLEARIEELGMSRKGLEWYLDTRRFGSAPHSGFGLGFERLLLFVTGMSNIRDVIPFPRTPNNLEF